MLIAVTDSEERVAVIVSVTVIDECVTNIDECVSFLIAGLGVSAASRGGC